MDYKAIQKAIVPGQKVTIVFSGWFGGMTVLQTVVQEVKPNYHYINCPESKIGVTFIHKPKRKRTLYKTEIEYSAPVIVYDGWIDIDPDQYVYEITHENGMEIKRSRSTMHDDIYFKMLLEDHPNPIVKSMRGDK